MVTMQILVKRGESTDWASIGQWFGDRAARDAVAFGDQLLSGFGNGQTNKPRLRLLDSNDIVIGAWQK